MKIVNRSDELKSRLGDLSRELSVLERDAVLRDEKKFDDVSGCKTCRGRGWVVTWDTLDSMSGCYHESSSCSAEGCTPESRELSGLHPSNTKYDNFHNNSRYNPAYSDEDVEKKTNLETEISQVRAEIDVEIRRFTPEEGKIVKVVKAGRGPKDRQVPVGTSGLVKKSFFNDWGTQKLLIVDKTGNKWWPHAKKVAVIDPEPDMEFWNRLEQKERNMTGFPVVATIKAVARSGKASLIRTTTGVEMWVPKSQAAELDGARRGQTLSLMLPMWLATEKGLVPKERVS